MLKQLLEEIKKQGAKYSKFSNQWNVMQQLIDIVSVQPDSAEIVLQDLKVNEMSLTALVSKITGKRLADPFEVMKTICDFYKIPCPDTLPPEVWRQDSGNASAPVALSGVVNLLDFI